MGGVLRGVRDVVQAMRVTASQPALTEDAPAEFAGSADARVLAEVRAILLQVREGQYRAARQAETLQRGQEEILEFVRSVLDVDALNRAFETEKQISQLLREGLLDEEPPPRAATSPSQGAP